MQECSPNWYWSRLGCTVTRRGWHRTITALDGAVICVNAGADTEQGISRVLYFGMIAVFKLMPAGED